MLNQGTATTIDAGPEAEIILEANAERPFRPDGRQANPRAIRQAWAAVDVDGREVRQTLTGYAEGRFGRIPS